MRVRKHAGIEQPRTAAVEEVIPIAEQRLQSFERVLRLRLEIVDVDER